MRLIKILNLWLLVGVWTFDPSIACEEQIDESMPSVGGGISPRPHSARLSQDIAGSESASAAEVIEKDKEEAEDRDSGSESSVEQAADIKTDGHPKTKSELFSSLVGAPSIASGRFFPSEFDNVLKIIKMERESSVTALERKVTAVGLNKVLADAGEAYGRVHYGDKDMVATGNLRAQYEPSDISNITENLYMLHQTLLLATRRNPSVTIEDLLALEANELAILKNVLELYEESLFMKHILLKSDSAELSVMRSGVDKANVLTATKGQVFDKSLMRKMTQSSDVNGNVE